MPDAIGYDQLKRTDILERQDAWIAQIENRPPRARQALAALIDGSVLREALAP